MDACSLATQGFGRNFALTVSKTIRFSKEKQFGTFSMFGHVDKIIKVCSGSTQTIFMSTKSKDNMAALLSPPVKLHDLYLRTNHAVAY